MSKEAYSYIRLFLIVIIVCSLGYIAFMKIFGLVIVSGNSMEPTYHDGDILMCTREFGEIERNDIIVFTYSMKPCVKRVIAVPGDEISVEGGQFVVNDVFAATSSDAGAFAPISDAGVLNGTTRVLQAGEYFCAGDNRENSTDSRTFGPVQYKNIKYLVKKRVYSKHKGG